MSTHVVPMTTGTFKVSPINFYCSPGRSNGPLIRLGFIAEIFVPKLRGLGLIARTQLNEFEIESIGELSRRILERPYDYLVNEFDQAWHESDPGQAIEYLTSCHPHSLRFEALKEEDVPRRLFLDGQPIRSLILAYMVEALEEGGFTLKPLQKDDWADSSVLPNTGIVTEAA